MKSTEADYFTYFSLNFWSDLNNVNLIYVPKKSPKPIKKFDKFRELTKNKNFRLMHSQNFNHESLYPYSLLDTHAAHRVQKKKVCFYLLKRWKTDEFSIRFQQRYARRESKAYICNWRWILKLTSENYENENTFALQSHLHDFVANWIFLLFV